MERYDSYKDSGVKWLGEIPSHWEIHKLSHFLQPFSVKGHPERQLLSVVRDKGVVIRGEKGEDGNNNVIPEDLSGYKVVNTGNFVINKMKSWQGSYGVSLFDGIVSPAYFVYKLNFPNKVFFNAAIRSKAYIPFFMMFSKGIRVDQWDLTPESLKQIPFFVPSPEEQEAIVEYLDKATSKIDESIKQQQEMIDLLNERKQIIINQAVCKGLNPDVPMKDSGFDWIGDIPVHWTALPIIRCCTLIRKRVETSQSLRISLENIESGTGKYIPTGSIYEGQGVEFQANDILFGKLRPYLAKVMLVEGIGEALGDIWVLRSNSIVIPEYLRWVLSSKRIIELIDSTTYGAKMPRADWKVNSRHSIPIPPLEEQRSISNYLNKISTNIDISISLFRQIVSFLQVRKQIIINEVITGKVKVS